MKFCSECDKQFEPKMRTTKTCSKVCSKKREIRLRKEKQREKRLASKNYQKQIKNEDFVSHKKVIKRKGVKQKKEDEEKNQKMISKFLETNEPSVK